MDPAQLLSAAESAGCRLIAEGDTLRVRGPVHNLDADLREQLREQKADILALLRARTDRGQAIAGRAGQADRHDLIECDGPKATSVPAVVELPAELRYWPPALRYQLADLECRGLTRAAAVDVVRGGGLGGGVELPGDRRAWPEDAKAAFWATVKWLNADARERGNAVEGKSPTAVADAEEAVRQTWRRPLPLEGDPT